VLDADLLGLEEVTDGLDLCADEYEEDDLRDILTHVYAYEGSSKRNSKRIITKVEQIGQEKGFIEGDEDDVSASGAS